MILKRILSNIIDFFLFILTFFILFKTTGLEPNIENVNFQYSLSFLIVFVLPILTINNTIGKEIQNLTWQSNSQRKLKLFIKYSIYFFTFLPSFSITSAILSLPFLNTELSYSFNNLFPVILITYVITDVLLFIFSLGKYHILDYLLGLSLDGSAFKKTLIKSLLLIYTFWGLLFYFNLFQYKYNLAIPTVGNAIQTSIYNENYPFDLFHGSDVFVIKEKSSYVVSPSITNTFLYSVNCDQKTLYLNVPEHLFNSQTERHELCLKLILQSRLNDAFNGYSPVQTKIVLLNARQGKFLEYYNSYYIYYFDSKIKQWGIYGGIVADSVTKKNYIDFTNNYLPKKIQNIEKETGLTWNKIVKKSNNDTAFENQLSSIWTTHIKTTISFNSITINIDSSELKLRKVNFSDVKPVMFVGYNFPIIDFKQRVNFTNLINDKRFEFDENLDYLIFLRNETTNKHL